MEKQAAAKLAHAICTLALPQIFVQTKLHNIVAEYVREEEVEGYYLAVRDDMEMYFFSESEVDMYFDIDGSSIKVNRKKHLCSKEDDSHENRCAGKGKFLCQCYRWDSWWCNHMFNHAKGTVENGYFGVYCKSTKLLGVLHLESSAFGEY